MNEFTTTPEGALITVSALGALMCALIVWAATRGARARAQEKARAWADLKRPDWEARAARKRALRESGARADARLRGALMSAVAFVALAATNLSAHATITAMARIGLRSIDTAVSAIVVFEMFLGILGALSWWHMRKGSGFNYYELGVWAMAALMGGIAWWGGNSPIFGLWPMLAAVAWHVVITFGRERKGSLLSHWWRSRFGVAMSGDADARYAERLHSKRARHGIAANVGPKMLRRVRAHLYRSAQMRAQELGIYDDDARASEQMRAAAYYIGARALAPEAVARFNPWTDERASESARSARKTRVVGERALERAQQSAPDERSQEGARIESTPATERASEATAPARTDDEVFAVIAKHFAGPSHALEWTQKFWSVNGKLPSGDILAEAFELSAGNCRKWLTPVRRALKTA